MTAERFAFQLTMLEKGAEEMQRQISRLDDVLFKIKASGVTVWTALMGWAVADGRGALISLGAVVIIGFWLLEGMFRAAQLRFVDRARLIAAFLNDAQRLDDAFASRVLPERLVYPVAFAEPPLVQLRMYGRALGSAPVVTLYLFLGLVNLLLWLAPPGGA